MSRDRSKVWEYFTAGSENVSCKICKAIIKQGSDESKKKNTSNLWSHLKHHHRNIHDELQVTNRPTAGIKRSRTDQPTLRDLFDSVKKWGGAEDKSKVMDKLIIEMIATDNQPFTIVSDIGFQRLLNVAEPRYKLKTEKFYRTESLPEIHQKVVAKMKLMLTHDEAGNISFTTDCWSGTTESLMSLTAHYIDKNWERKQVLLNVKAMQGSHTGEYIAETFDEMLNDWGIQKDRVFLVLRDGGANIVKGMRLAEVDHLSCFAHSLQLVINNGIDSQRAVKNALTKFRNIATHFRHSVIAKQHLKEIQKSLDLPDHSILQSVPTRWNSNVHMLVRMLEQKHALIFYASKYGHISMPDANDWEIGEKLIATLKPFDDITLEVSKATASISIIIPSVNVLKMLLESVGPSTRGIQTMRTELLDGLNRRFSSLYECRQVVIACLLDPRYKDRPFTDVSAKSRAKDWLQEEMSSYELGADNRGMEIPDASNQPSCSTSTVDIMYATLLRNEESASTSEYSQLDQYICEPVVSRNVDPLEWWRQNKIRFPILASVVRKYLASPPTTVPSERVFSTVGNIYSDRRCSLHGENAEKLCFLNYNLRLLGWKY
uniref:zinc finger BED domain-containing protein 4-like n=1 Tax=Styela clava TaxID=7725 RepID=UPI00193A8077|nr:zinc finger BED domain-containing protein 4-like [Styela clava]